MRGECGIADEKRDVGVEILKAAMLGDGGAGRASVDDAEFGLNDEVGRAGIELWIGEKKAESGAGIDAGDVRFGLMSGESGDGFGSFGGIAEPE